MKLACTNPATKQLRTPEVSDEYDTRVLDFSEGNEPDVRQSVAESMIDRYPSVEAADSDGGGSQLDADSSRPDEPPRGADDPDPLSEPPVDPSEYTIPELDDHLTEHNYSDLVLRQLWFAEHDNENRVGVLELIERNFDQFEWRENDDEER